MENKGCLNCESLEHNFSVCSYDEDVYSDYFCRKYQKQIDLNILYSQSCPLKLEKICGVRLAVIGSRNFTNYAEMKEALDKVAQHINIDLIISGGARGADSLAEHYAREKNIQTLIFPADWEKYGRKAGIVRNYDIIRNCDMVVAFWDGKSKGTAHSISVAKEQKKKVLIYQFYKKG